MGVLAVAPEPRYIAAFQAGLRDNGYVDGQNVIIEFRYSQGRGEPFPSLAAELVDLRVDVIVAVTTPAARAAKGATTTIPIVFVAVGDPVASGVVASLARPGGNATGLSFFAEEAVGKQLEFIKQAVPRTSRVTMLWDQTASAMLDETERAARLLSLRLEFVEVKASDDFSTAFATVIKQQPDALVILPSALTFILAKRIVEFAASRHLPTIYPFREAVEGGGLMCYATLQPDLFKRAAGYVAKIFNGAKPADLPVERPTKFELVINLKTAKALGLTIPQSLLLRADQVIE